MNFFEKRNGSGFGIGKQAEAGKILSRIIENIYIALNRLLVEIWMLMTTSEDSEGSEDSQRKHIILESM